MKNKINWFLTGMLAFIWIIIFCIGSFISKLKTGDSLIISSGLIICFCLFSFLIKAGLMDGTSVKISNLLNASNYANKRRERIGLDKKQKMTRDEFREKMNSSSYITIWINFLIYSIILIINMLIY